MSSRRDFLRLSLTGAAAALVTRSMPAHALTADLTVYKSSSCGCCKKWVEHLKKNGFSVSVKDMDDISAIKSTMGVPKALQSCHTAVFGAYVIEGHVPADVMRKLEHDKPKIVGLAVPGMPNDAPGMDGQGGGFKVISWDKDGRTGVYASR